MAIIKLQTRLLLDNTNQNPDILLFIQTVHEYIISIIMSRFFRERLKSWLDFQKNQQETVNLINDQINKFAPNYLSSLKYEFQALSSRNIIRFQLKDVEILESSSINEIDKLKVAVYFLSDPLELVKSFGSYILLSAPNDKTHTNTFMLELSEDLTINSYQ